MQVPSLAFPPFPFLMVEMMQVKALFCPYTSLDVMLNILQKSHLMYPDGNVWH
jgi:hypothetical protein